MFFVVLFMCLNVKLIKIICTFCTKVCDSTKNYDKKQLCKEVEDGYTLVTLKKILTI